MMHVNSIDEVIQHLDAVFGPSKTSDGKMTSSTIDSKTTSEGEGKSIVARLFGNERSRVIGIHSIHAIIHDDCVTDLTFRIGRQLPGASQFPSLC
jgi:predicted ATP-dependent Lon-type protease